MSNKVAPNALSKIALVFILLIPFAVYSQQATDTLPHKKKEHRSIGIGIKAGFNFSNVTNASSISAGSRTGYHLGLLIAPAAHGIIGSRTELIYSRHGYNYTTDTSSGSINLDYIMLCQYVAIHITKYFEIHLGGQTAYLLHAKADSSQPSTGNASVDQMLSFYNRFDYGFGLGAEVHPVSGLLIGARYNISLNNLYKQPSFSPGQGAGGQLPSFAPSVDLKNNVVQLYLGYRF